MELFKRSNKKDRQTIQLTDANFWQAAHNAIVDRMEEGQLLGVTDPEQAQQVVVSLLQEYMESRAVKFESTEIFNQAVQMILNEIIGFGPLEPLLSRDDISDILINNAHQVFIEREGKLETSDVSFIDNDHVLRILRRMLAPIGKRIDESSPMVDARLADGSRINAIIPPLSLDGPVVSIRRFFRQQLTESALIASEAVTLPLMQFLTQATLNRRNLMISGGTGSGKTTLLNVLSQHIHPDERVVTIEDSAELRLENSHVVRLETRPPNTEGKGEVTARQLVKNSLRMRPDRIILGESRGDEVLDVLQAMNTGHMGSMSTVHANSALDALVRLQMMVRMSEFKGSDQLVSQIIATAIDAIVHVERDSQGHRHVKEVLLITGLQGHEVASKVIYFRGELEHLAEVNWTKRIGVSGG